MLARARLRNDPALAEAAREERLAEGVVELVRAGVEQVLALQVEALVGGEALRARERSRTAPERAREILELLAERFVSPRIAPACFELVEGRDQRLRDEAPPVLPVRQLHLAASTYARTRA